MLLEVWIVRNTENIFQNIMFDPSQCSVVGSLGKHISMYVCTYVLYVCTYIHTIPSTLEDLATLMRSTP